MTETVGWNGPNTTAVCWLPLAASCDGGGQIQRRQHKHQALRKYVCRVEQVEELNKQK